MHNHAPITIITQCILVASSIAAAGEWTLQTTTGPSERAVHTMAYDANRGVTVLFGGGQYEYDAETWEWDGEVWTFRSAVGGVGPEGRAGHGMTYDAGRGVMLLFGGLGNESILGDTWTWDGVEWTLVATDGPAPRIYATLAYDAVRDVVVLFGGIGEGYYNDTWEWDGTTWTQRSHEGPSPRYLHTMNYDVARDVTVLFGGFDGSVDGETWEWNGQAWTQRDSGSLSPRYLHAMTYDTDRHRTVLYGGQAGGLQNETWEWDGDEWTLVTQDGPPVRAHTALAYDEIDHRVLLFGGWDGDTFYDDTWTYAESGVEIVAAQSCLTHAAGDPQQAELCIDLPDGVGVEPRLGGPERLVVEMNADLDPAGVIPANVQVQCANQASPAVLASLDAGNVLTVDLVDALTDVDCCRFTFDGMQSLDGDPVVGSVQLSALRGDLNFSGGVTGSDAALVKPHFGEQLGFDLAAPQWDYDRNGAVTGGDFAAIKTRFGNQSPECP